MFSMLCPNIQGILYLGYYCFMYWCFTVRFYLHVWEELSRQGMLQSNTPLQGVWRHTLPQKFGTHWDVIPSILTHTWVSFLKPAIDARVNFKIVIICLWSQFPKELVKNSLTDEQFPPPTNFKQQPCVAKCWFHACFYLPICL